MASGNKHRRFKPYLDLLDSFGVAKDFRMEMGGKHHHLTGSVFGQKVTFVLPFSPGDRRTQLNMLKHMSRKLRSLGLKDQAGG